MDARIGLDYIVENREYVEKLGTALDTNNVTVKKQVFELLSALCAYNGDGYTRALETLEHYKDLKQTRYRFKIVVVELDAPETPIEYQVALLSFVNCVIISTQGLQDRLRVRNEFIGLKILPVLCNLRRVSGGVADIAVQLDVFDEQRECDEAQSLQGPSDINLNSHLDVFYAILGQVADTPQEIPFLSILQHLLRIDSKEAISDIIWDTAETLVHRATLLENREDSTRLLRTPSVQKFTCPHCRSDISSPNRKQSIVPLNNPLSPSASFIERPPPIPPPPPAAPPPPPPMMMQQSSSITNHQSKSTPPAPPAPPFPASNSNSNAMTALRPKTPDIDPAKLLPQQETPVPKAKMKTINWNKIPPSKVMGKNNIWTMVANSHSNSPMTELDWSEMEGLFCQQATNTQGSPKTGRDSSNSHGDSSVCSAEKKGKKENSEIVLLDGKRSLNVNIFLKQFRTSNEEIIQLIRNGEHDDIGAEKLRGLLKILPEVDELDMLKCFDGEKSRLGNAEKFLMQLSQVPNYKLRVESMLLKEEFASNLSYLEPSINAMIYAGDDLMNNALLREVLYMVVVAGNFLNAGGYAGNAAGVKLSSLQKLTDIRANKPGMNLIHFVALQAEKRNRQLLTFPEKLTGLENSSRTTVEQINNEINALDARIIKIKRQVELPTTETDVKRQMTDFLYAAEHKCEQLKEAMKEVEGVRLQLAEFFCEDPATFKLEECFKIFQNFCEKFKLAVSENERRRIQEEQAAIRRKLREEQIAKRARQSQAGTPVSDSDNSLLMDPSQFDMRASPAMTRRRIGSFNSNGEASLQNREDGFSPDITPTGSLRRRRSRVLSEEDDNGLMDFLRSSGHDNGLRERKPSSYGSLDRSWARRARSGSNSRKRPELLNIDFSEDRERPISPALPQTLPETVTTVPKDENRNENRPREWRQKIENWLQANEQDEKHNEEYKRRARRLAGNRRSFENDSENERSKLDPLPEEKAAAPTMTTTPSSEYKRVYPDWKPSTALEKTDVVGNIEAIEDAQSTRSRDKSAWRKSNLNVPNSSEDTEYSSRSSRNKMRDSLSSNTSPVQLQSIDEEDRRKGEKYSPSETTAKSLNRRTSDAHEYEPVYQKYDTHRNPVTITSDQHSIYIRPTTSSHRSPTSPADISISTLPLMKTIQTKVDEQSHNKIEIDSDNIETPPAIRRNIVQDNKVCGTATKKLQAPRPLHRKTIEDNLIDVKDIEADANQTNTINQNETLGDGQFDRHSSARRTRRYRRPTDHSNEDRSDTSPELPSPSEPIYPISRSQNNSKQFDIKKSSSKDSELHSPKVACKDEINNTNILSRVGKMGRNISAINQEDVREAIRNLKSPTETPDRIWSPPREIVVVKEKPTPLKAINHELNDEGFEETQSLVSDTPSHGKDSTSSCNDQADKTDNRVKVTRMTSSESTATATSTDAPSKRRPVPKSTVQNLLERNRQSLERSRSLRTSGATMIRNIIPKRTNSLRRSDLHSTPQSKKDVERSNSRTSLRSSRSSLNSATSTNTVRNMALKTTAAPIEKTSYNKSLNLSKSLSPTTRTPSKQNTPVRTPASRSSSSGSSVSPSIRHRGPNKVTISPNSNSGHGSPQQKPAFRSAVSTSSISTSPTVAVTLRNTPSARLSNLTKGIASKTARVSNFMRPTTASATKISNGKGK